MTIQVFLPFPPSVNNYYKQTRSGGHKYLPKEVRDYRDRVDEAINQQVPGLEICYNIAVSCQLYMPDKRKRDLDNYMKGLLDAVTQAGLWTDDSLIDQLTIYRGEKIKGGNVILTITAADPVLTIPIPENNPL